MISFRKPQNYWFADQIFSFILLSFAKKIILVDGIYKTMYQIDKSNITDYKESTPFIYFGGGFCLSYKGLP